MANRGKGKRAGHNTDKIDGTMRQIAGKLVVLLRAPTLDVEQIALKYRNLRALAQEETVRKVIGEECWKKLKRLLATPAAQAVLNPRPAKVA